MADSYFRHGNPIMIDYTPSAGNISAGEFVLIGNTTGLTCGIAHNDIENTVLGAVAAGGGVYRCQVAANYPAGTKVHKPSGNALLTSTATNNAQVGFTLEAAAAANAWVNVLHHPYVPT